MANHSARKLIYFALWKNILGSPRADVAELADALDSKSSIREDVWVRPPPSAPYKSTTCVELLDMLLQCCYTVTQEIGYFPKTAPGWTKTSSPPKSMAARHSQRRCRGKNL